MDGVNNACATWVRHLDTCFARAGYLDSTQTTSARLLRQSIRNLWTNPFSGSVDDEPDAQAPGVSSQDTSTFTISRSDKPVNEFACFQELLTVSLSCYIIRVIVCSKYWSFLFVGITWVELNNPVLCDISDKLLM